MMNEGPPPPPVAVTLTDSTLRFTFFYLFIYPHSNSYHLNGVGKATEGPGVALPELLRMDQLS